MPQVIHEKPLRLVVSGPGRNEAVPAEHPARVIIGHPFNPVYLLPLVETVAGDKTSEKAMEQAKVFYESIGMRRVLSYRSVLL